MLEQSCTEEAKQKYKEFRNMLNRVKRYAKINFYNGKSAEYQYNTKKLWQLINGQLGKCKHNGSIIPCISVDGIKQYEPKAIANQFGKFYSELGVNLALTIKHIGLPLENYLNNIPRKELK